MTGLRRAMRDRDRESGAAMVELLVVMGVLVVLVFGIIEFGNGWKNKLEVETAARAGARVGSSLGNDRLADYGLLQGTKSALANLGLSNVDYVVVYKSTTTNGQVPAACSGSTPTSQTNVCNVYTGSQLDTLTQASFTGTTSCTGSSPDRFWCPLTRKNVQSQGADYLGVWIKADSATLTAFFGSPLEIQSRAVMRLEPK
jgi:Flp pilus assembly protein TadG